MKKVNPMRKSTEQGSTQLLFRKVKTDALLLAYRNGDCLCILSIV